jgi:predicted transcriptional regulator
MNETGSIKRNILQVIPTDNSFAQAYLHELEQQSVRQQAILAGIADADAGRLTGLEAVKAKWLPRKPHASKP